MTSNCTPEIKYKLSISPFACGPNRQHERDHANGRTAHSAATAIQKRYRGFIVRRTAARNIYTATPGRTPASCSVSPQSFHDFLRSQPWRGGSSDDDQEEDTPAVPRLRLEMLQPPQQQNPPVTPVASTRKDASRSFSLSPQASVTEVGHFYYARRQLGLATASWRRSYASWSVRRKALAVALSGLRHRKYCAYLSRWRRSVAAHREFKVSFAARHPDAVAHLDRRKAELSAASTPQRHESDQEREHGAAARVEEWLQRPEDPNPSHGQEAVPSPATAASGYDPVVANFVYQAVCHGQQPLETAAMPHEPGLVAPSPRRVSLHSVEVAPLPRVLILSVPENPKDVASAEHEQATLRAKLAASRGGQSTPPAKLAGLLAQLAETQESLAREAALDPPSAWA